MSEHIPDGYDPDLFKIRHSLAHVMAQAVLERYPTAKLAFGPPTDVGFYYDFDLPAVPGEEDLTAIEERMREIIASKAPFVRRDVSPDEARELFAGQAYKIELIDDLASGRFGEHGHEGKGEPTAISVYEDGTFADICRGPHVEDTGRLPRDGFKLLHTAGAYWRGDEKRPMLTRIYATAWKNRKDLKAYLQRLEEAQKRDHRKVGRELELFTMNPLVGSGLPIWLPKGATIRRELERYIVDLERAHGYEHVYTPPLAKQALYEVSGHWAHYKDDMFPIMDLGTESLVLRPMNCPHHMMVYGARLRSYRDLPLRVAELGQMFRYERSGVVSGLSRVRAMTLNDAHIFCRPDQVKTEFAAVVSLVEQAYATLGITEYSYRLSLRDPTNKEKYVDNDAMWEMGEAQLREVLDELGLPYKEGKGEAAFYGPKLDIQLADVMGREETVSTIQLDFHLPNRFDLSYVDEDSNAVRPVIIHRGVISTMERMIAYLIELYAGAFPVWMHPVQVTFVPVTDRAVEYANDVAARLKALDLRVEVDDTSQRMNAKVRTAQLAKNPYIVVVGDREVEAGTLSVRLRTGRQLPPMSVDDFEALVLRMVRTRSLELAD